MTQHPSFYSGRPRIFTDSDLKSGIQETRKVLFLFSWEDGLLASKFISKSARESGVRKLSQNGQIIHALFLEGLATDDTAAFVSLRPAKDFHRFGFEIWNPRNQESFFSLFLGRRAPGFQIHFKIFEGIRYRKSVDSAFVTLPNVQRTSRSSWRTSRPASR